MYRRKLIIGIIVLVVIFLIGFVYVAYLMSNQTDRSTGENVPVSDLNYCNVDELRPCVVSFGFDGDDNMLVNLLIPELSFPNFYMTIVRGENQISYLCRRVAATKSNAYCVGEKLPPGEVLHLMLISVEDDILLAEGDLSIIGLAFPTLGVTTPTSVPTETSDGMGTPTLLPPVTLTPISTQPSYPNSTSYP